MLVHGGCRLAVAVVALDRGAVGVAVVPVPDVAKVVHLCTKPGSPRSEYFRFRCQPAKRQTAAGV